MGNFTRFLILWKIFYKKSENISTKIANGGGKKHLSSKSVKFSWNNTDNAQHIKPRGHY